MPEEHRPLVRPVEQFLEDQEDRALAGRRNEQLRECSEQAVAMSFDARGHRLFGEVDPPANLGRNLAELEGAVDLRQTAAKGLRRRHPDEPLKHCDERRERHERFAIAAPDEHGGAFGRRPREFHREPALSDARFAGQEDQLLVPFARQAPRFFERSQFGVAPDEGDRRCGERYEGWGRRKGSGQY